MTEKKVQTVIEALRIKSIELRKKLQDTGEFDPMQHPDEPVLFTGSVPSPVLAIARDLGKNEVLEKEILVGTSGQIFRQTMSSVGYEIDNGDYCMINLVPYKPVKNKPFSIKIQKAFFPIVQYLIKIINPDKIICMGYQSNSAIQGFTKITSILNFSKKCYGGVDMQFARGKGLTPKTIRIIPTAHPSFFQRNGGLKGSICREKFVKLIKAGLEGIEEQEPTIKQIVSGKPKKKSSSKKGKSSVQKDPIFRNTGKDKKVPQELVDEFVEDIKQLKDRGVQEYTLYTKWEEIQNLKIAKARVKEVLEIKNNLWTPKSPEDYLDLEPELIFCHGDMYWERCWRYLRIFTSSMIWKQSPGRIMKYIIRDKKTKKFLGIISAASDFMAMRPRDQYIGWTADDRQKKKLLRNTLVGSTIVPTQPLGYNYLGGKLISLLLLSNDIQEKWNEKYGDKLVGATTTSLYGSFSQYTNLKYWKHVGHSAGTILITPTPKLWDKVRKFMRETYPKQYAECASKGGKKGYKDARKKGKTNIKTGPKQNVLMLLLKKFGIKTKFLQGQFERGIYFARLFENTNEFLRSEITEEDLIPRADFSVETLTELWKKKYASKRIKKLVKDKRTNMETLFYDDLITLTWDQARKKYLENVGR